MATSSKSTRPTGQKSATKTKPAATAKPKGVKTGLSKALQENFGFDAFKGPQEEIIESLLAGSDSLVIMPTGGGKSLCYQLPAIISERIARIKINRNPAIYFFALPPDK